MAKINCAPWFNSVLHEGKQWLRQAERKWCKSYDPVARTKYRLESGNYKKIILMEKASYYEACILNAKDLQKETFKVWRELSRAKSKRQTAAPEDCNRMQVFFLDKIRDIRREIASTSLCPCSLVPTTMLPYNGLLLASFPQMDMNSLSNWVNRVKSGSPADPCPPELFKATFPVIG